MAVRYQRYDAGSFLLAVDGYENGVLRGLFYRPCCRTSGRFSSLTQLLLRLEQTMNVEDCPQSFQANRSFFPLREVWGDGGGERNFRNGQQATFVLQILFRRNSSWQGSLTWVEGRQTEQFRSVLELIGLLNSAVASRQMFHTLQSLEWAE